MFPYSGRQRLRTPAALLSGPTTNLLITTIKFSICLTMLQVATALTEYTHSHQHHHRHQQHASFITTSAAADIAKHVTSSSSTTVPTAGIQHTNWRRIEMMDANGLYWLEWWLKGYTSQEIFFRVTVNTRGFIGLGFARKSPRMANADLVLLWVDDRTGKANALDCHGSAKHPNSAPIQDDTQNYNVIDGGQNGTHTWVEFSRKLETCDPYDLPLGVDTIKVLWTFGETDPIYGDLKGHGKNRGFKSLNLFGPMFRKESNIDTHKWDVTVQNVTIESNMDTLYWCKIIRAPTLSEKHHIIGYEALLSRESNTNKPLVHHMTLFECSTKSYPGSDPLSWEVWVKSSGAVCNSNLLTPHDWDSCITPVAVWTIGSTGTNTNISIYLRYPVRTLSV
ncbi:MOXD1 homolog 1-like, partial [Rhagoletis pomonella]|uniref:MOXD1 homolog 1-like n=1 Tax=Rhagoletis pomonella TaxID=28610 RepID=UPI00177D221C